MAKPIIRRLLFATARVRAQSSPNERAVRTDWEQRLTYGRANGISDSITAGELVITRLVLLKKDFQLIKKRIKTK
jgi:hypothetical protein